MDKDYVMIGDYFARALEGEKIDIFFEQAIRIMQIKPELVARIPQWDEAVWFCIQEYLNSNPPVMGADRDDLFLQACALLEN